jgi:hypothetical protein
MTAAPWHTLATFACLAVAEDRRRMLAHPRRAARVVEVDGRFAVQVRDLAPAHVGGSVDRVRP